nr:integrase, catalytic region, zinc finger, CCHC-type, peptidase aspartic, catalytic [Tanacetum cinerariifolium]
MQTQTSNTLHNAIMEAGSKDRPPMLAPGNYVQWKSRIKRYIDTKPNHELIHYCLENPLYKLGWKDKEVPSSEGSLVIRTERVNETYKNVSQDIRDQLNAEAEAVQIILCPYLLDIYSTVDACPNACEMWKAIKRNAGYENQRIGNVVGAMENVSNDDHYNVFTIERTHPKQSESVLDTYPIEQDAQNLIEIVLFIVDSGCSKQMTGNLKLLINFVEKFLGTVKFGNDQIAPILGYGDLVQGAVTIKRVYYVEGLNRVILITSVSRPQLKSNPQGDRVMHNNSQGKKPKVEDHCRSVKLSKNKTSVTACNDSLNAKTLNVKSVYATCDKCVLHDKHDMCVLKFVAKPIKRTVAFESNKKPRNFTRKLYERVSKTCSWWYPKFTPSRYKWKPKSGKENVNSNLVEIVLFIVDSGCSKHMTGNLKLLINFVEKFLRTVKFGNDQIAPILGYGDLVQGAVTIKRVYYVEGVNHNLFSVSQFCDADLEVAFRKSTCFIHDLKRNDLLTGSHGTD